MRISPIHKLYAEDDIDIDWNLVLAAERTFTGADIHDGRALLCRYRNACDALKRYPGNKYELARRDNAAQMLRKLIAGATVTETFKASQAWWFEVGRSLYEETEK